MRKSGLRRGRFYVISHFVILTCLACATGNRVNTASAKTSPSSLTSNHRYYYRAIVNRTYDLSSLGFAGETRELSFVVGLWVSVGLNQTHKDTVYFQARVDSSQIQFQKTIPELILNNITLPSDLGPGITVKGPIILRQRDTSVRVLQSSLASGNVLFVLAPDPIAATAATIDTSYSGQRASRVDQDVFMNSLGFFLVNNIPLNTSDGNIEIRETPSDIQGKSQYYFEKNGTLIGAKLNRQMKTNTKLSAPIGTMVLDGFGTDSVSVNRLP